MSADARQEFVPGASLVVFREAHVVAMVTRGKRSRKKSTMTRPRGSLGGAPARNGSVGLIVVMAGLVLVNLYVFLWRKGTSVPAVKRAALNEPLEGAATAAPPKPATPVVTAPPQHVAAHPGAHSHAAASTPAEPVVSHEDLSGSLDGAIEKGDSLGKVLHRMGLGGAARDEVIRAVEPVLDMKKLRIGQPIHVERDTNGRVTLFETKIGAAQVVRAQRNGDGKLVGALDEPAAAAAAPTPVIHPM